MKAAHAYASYSETGIECIGRIPTTWSLTNLKREVDSNRRITYGIVQAGPNVEGGVPYIRPADMSDEGGVADLAGLLRTSEAIASSYSRSSIEVGDLVCSIGPSFGKVMAVPEELNGANLTQGTARVAVSNGNSSRYMFWALRSPTAFQQWESSVGGATFRALNLGPLAETRLPRPPVAEQNQIAKFLDYETAKIDALIEKQQQLIALLKEKRQAVISHAVTKGLNPDAPMRDPGVEWLGEVPAHWTIWKFGHFAPIITCGIASTPTYVDEGEGMPFLSAQNIRENKLSLHKYNYIPHELHKQLTRYRRPEVGDLLVTRVGAGIGDACIVDTDMEFSIYVSLTHIRVAPSIAVNRFIKYFFGSDYCKYLNFQGTVTGGGVGNLNVQNVEKYKIPLPTPDEQRQIADYLDQQGGKFIELVQKAESAMTLLQERRTALISAAVTGKIDVRGWKAPDSEPEAEVA